MHTLHKNFNSSLNTSLTKKHYNVRMCCEKFYLVIFYFIFIAFFAAAPAFGAVAAPVASHAEISLFRAKEAEKIAQLKDQFKTNLDVLGALACLHEKLDKSQISFIQFSRFVLACWLEMVTQMA